MTTTRALFFSMNPVVKKSDVLNVLEKKFYEELKKEEIKEILKSSVGSSRRNVTYEEFSETIRVIDETLSSKEPKDLENKTDLRVENLSSLSVDEVSTLLQSNKLNAFVETFRKEEITGDMLMDICEEDLEEFNLGIVYFQHGNFEDFSEKLKSLLQDKEKRESLRKLSLENIKNFSWENRIKKII